jgi:hypothetical protein
MSRALPYRFTCSRCRNTVESLAKPDRVNGRPVCASCTWGSIPAPAAPVAPAAPAPQAAEAAPAAPRAALPCPDCGGACHVQGIPCERCNGRGVTGWTDRARRVAPPAPAARCFAALTFADLDPGERRDSASRLAFGGAW